MKTDKGSANLSANLSDDFSANLQADLFLSNHTLNPVSADSADETGNSITHARAGGEVGRRADTAGTAGTGRLPKASRALIFQAWLDAGQPWPPTLGLGAVLDHALDACRDKGRGFRW